MSEQIKIVCGSCESVVAVPRGRLDEAPRCPKCKQALLGGKPLELTTANFARHVARNDLPLVVDFWAPWCGPCLAMAPHFESAAKKLGARLRFAKLNTQDEPGPAGEFNIKSIPTMIVFKAGEPAARQSGAMDSATLARWLEGVA